MKTAERDSMIAEVIADKFMGWKWSAGSWHDESDAKMGDYFDPMNDPAICTELAKEFNVTVGKNPMGTWTAKRDTTSGEVWQAAGTEHHAICFCLCNCVNEHPETW